MCSLAHNTQQLCLQDKLPLFVFLAGLVRLVVLPPYSLLALPADDIAYHVATSCHAALYCLRLVDVHDVVEEECLAVLAAEVLFGRRALADTMQGIGGGGRLCTRLIMSW